MISLKPQGFRNQPSLSPPAGYICMLRDVSYGDRYQIVQLQDPDKIAVYLDQSFDVEIALVFQASDAGQSLGELLDFVGASRTGEWFDLADDRFKSLRSMGTAGRAHRRFSRPSNSLADLLAGSEPRAALPPSAPRRRPEAAAAAPRQARRSTPNSAPRRRQSPAPAPAASRQRSATPEPAPRQPRPRNRRGKLFVLLFAMLLFGLLYQPLSNRDLFEDLQNLIGTELLATPQVALSKPIAGVVSLSWTSVDFAWNAVPGATRYQYRYAVNDGGFSIWQSTNGLYRSLSDLDPWDQIIFEVIAIRGDELSPVTRLTARNNVAPTATKVNLQQPNARVANKTAASIRFEWDASEGASGYQYRYQVNDVNFSDWRNTNSRTFTLAVLDPGDQVKFELRALWGSSRSPVTRLNARTNVAPTATKVNLQQPNARVAEKSATSIRFAWDAVVGATGYQFRYQLNAGGYSDWQRTAGLGFTLSGLEPGDRINFELRAMRADERSPVTRLTARTNVVPTATSTQTLEPTATVTQSPEPSATNSPVPTATANASPEPSPTRLPSATPTATVEPSATATLQSMFVETRNNLGANARACPRTTCDILVTLRPDAEIQALGQVEGEQVYDSTLWIQFDFNGEMAYIHSELVEIKL